MSRIAKSPITVPKGVDIKIEGSCLTVKGTKGQLIFNLHRSVGVDLTDSILQVNWDRADKSATAQAGTARAIIQNMVEGVSKGFERKMTLIGVGYRAQAKGSILNLSLGFSHPVDFEVPAGISIDTPSQTEIVIKGCDKQQVGQVAAKIRAYRTPEPYKGKGIRYSDEQVARKEAKKK